MYKLETYIRGWGTTTIKLPGDVEFRFKRESIIVYENKDSEKILCIAPARWTIIEDEG